MTRIISGVAGSRKLASPAKATRPTSDRIRESIFNRLQARDWIDNKRVLDLYAGTGALALEAVSRGAIYAMMVERDGQAAAVCVNNANMIQKAMASEGFYDGVIFHRVINGFMAQGGDPTGTGMGGSDKPDLAAEFNAEPHVEGVCSMARAQNPNSANSQFFICLDDARFLDKQYTVWGQVISGMEHVHALPKGEPPRAPGKIVKATVA